jgi:hypothetical protein
MTNPGPNSQQLVAACLLAALLVGCGGAAQVQPNGQPAAVAQGTAVAAPDEEACGTTRAIDYPDDPELTGQTIGEALERAANGATAELESLQADAQARQGDSILSAELAAAQVRAEIYAVIIATAPLTAREGENAVVLQANDGVTNKGSVTLEDLGTGWAVTQEELVLPSEVCDALESRVPPPPGEEGPEMASETPAD